MFVARIKASVKLKHLGVDVLKTLESRTVELQIGAGFDLTTEEECRRFDDVVSRPTGQHFGFDRCVRIKGFVVNLDARRLLEIRKGVFADEIGPVVDADRPLCRVFPRTTGQQEKAGTE